MGQDIFFAVGKRSHFRLFIMQRFHTLSLEKRSKGRGLVRVRGCRGSVKTNCGALTTMRNATQITDKFPNERLFFVAYIKASKILVYVYCLGVSCMLHVQGVQLPFCQK